MSANPVKAPAKPSVQRPVNLGTPGSVRPGAPNRPGMSSGRKSALAIGLIAAGGMSIFAFTPREQCEVDPATGQQHCRSSSGSSSSSSHGSSGSSRSSWGWGSSSSDSGSGLIARGGFGSSGGLHFSGGG